MHQSGTTRCDSDSAPIFLFFLPSRARRHECDIGTAGTLAADERSAALSIKNTASGFPRCEEADRLRHFTPSPCSMTDGSTLNHFALVPHSALSRQNMTRRLDRFNGNCVTDAARDNPGLGAQFHVAADMPEIPYAGHGRGVTFLVYSWTLARDGSDICTRHASRRLHDHRGTTRLVGDYLILLRRVAWRTGIELDIDKGIGYWVSWCTGRMGTRPVSWCAAYGIVMRRSEKQAAGKRCAVKEILGDQRCLCPVGVHVRDGPSSRTAIVLVACVRQSRPTSRGRIDLPRTEASKLPVMASARTLRHDSRQRCTEMDANVGQQASIASITPLRLDVARHRAKTSSRLVNGRPESMEPSRKHRWMLIPGEPTAVLLRFADCHSSLSSAAHVKVIFRSSKEASPGNMDRPMQIGREPINGVLHDTAHAPLSYSSAMAGLAPVVYQRRQGPVGLGIRNSAAPRPRKHSKHTVTTHACLRLVMDLASHIPYAVLEPRTAPSTSTAPTVG
nr:hypothetical protein CFP56_38866 [Quercus suber]